MTVESYAVFEGGGVKGLAFAGALKAAEEASIKFVGYGGASAGAIIAFLAALGFNSDEIKMKMSEVEYLKLIEEPAHGELDNIKEIKDILTSDRSFKRKIIKLYFTSRYKKFIYSFMERIWTNKGAYKKRNIISLLSYYAYEKIEDIIDVNHCTEELTVSFKDFYLKTCVDFRVIATDVVTGEALEYSNERTPDACVFEAVAASSAFPIVFEPSNIDGRSLVDGGLSCNLPTYLFHGSEHKKLPIYAFDLISKEKKEVTKLDFPRHVLGLINSAVDASTNIISNVVGGIAVPVVVPTHIGTLDFNISNRDIDELFYSGYESARDFFKSHRLTRLLEEVNTDSDRASILYGNRFDFILNLLIDSLSDIEGQEELEGVELKAWLYTSVHAKAKNIISFAQQSSSDIDPNQHCFDLNDTSKDCVTSWHARSVVWSYDISNDKTRICFPITALGPYAIDGETQDDTDVLALLCISMNIHYDRCPWLCRNNYVLAGVEAYDIKHELDTMLSNFCYTIHKMMLGNQVSFHELKGKSDVTK
ncbi:hypothetical protein FCV50_23515 [Vibrio kanaloae]|uniref:PNPLA domain-containing protein n=1 Tax=Vibrio kanaloae TaxID=170673 RepID=A0A4U1YNU4_9VIBR|nr:hypothetical protein FCV50_23515 [Vibrio kanaloae]